jgi:hypothetical protein
VKTMKEVRKWAIETGCSLTYLVDRALKAALARKKEGVK